jgi:DNA-binding LacI/PurR family transcriptional regulator
MIKSGQITIKDIARELKVSASTVSRALKNHPDISQDTKDAVMALAKKLDYQPNSIALSLRKSKSFTIGIIIPEIVHHFFSSVISGIEDVAHEKGYNVIICQSNESYERELQNTNALLSSRVDGLLVSISRETNNYDHFKSIFNKGIPLVFFDRVYEKLETSMIVVDDVGGAFAAVEHLISIGCKKIAHLKGPDSLSISHKRMEGYIDALKKHNIEVKEELIVPGGLTKESGMEGARQLLNLSEKPDALFAFSDPVAIGAVLAFKEAGLKIPDDISIVGFSDEPITSLIEPSLTTVSQPGYEMGQSAANLFFDQIIDPENFVPQKKMLKTKLVIRNSTRKSN